MPSMVGGRPDPGQLRSTPALFHPPELAHAVECLDGLVAARLLIHKLQAGVSGIRWEQQGWGTGQDKETSTLAACWGFWAAAAGSLAHANTPHLVGGKDQYFQAPGVVLLEQQVDVVQLQ